MNIDTNAQTELELFFSNEEWLCKPAWIALSKAHKRGDLNYDKALKYLRNRYRDAAKQYTREHGSMTDSWQSLFSLSTRNACALMTLENMLAEFNLGNYWS